MTKQLTVPNQLKPIYGRQKKKRLRPEERNRQATIQAQHEAQRHDAGRVRFMAGQQRGEASRAEAERDRRAKEATGESARNRRATMVGASLSAGQFPTTEGMEILSGAAGVEPTDTGSRRRLGGGQQQRRPTAQAPRPQVRHGGMITWQMPGMKEAVTHQVDKRLQTPQERQTYVGAIGQARGHFRQQQMEASNQKILGLMQQQSQLEATQTQYGSQHGEYDQFGQLQTATNPLVARQIQLLQEQVEQERQYYGQLEQDLIGGNAGQTAQDITQIQGVAQAPGATWPMGAPPAGPGQAAPPSPAQARPTPAPVAQPVAPQPTAQPGAQPEGGRWAGIASAIAATAAGQPGAPQAPPQSPQAPVPQAAAQPPMAPTRPIAPRGAAPINVPGMEQQAYMPSSAAGLPPEAAQQMRQRMEAERLSGRLVSQGMDEATIDQMMRQRFSSQIAGLTAPPPPPPPAAPGAEPSARGGRYFTSMDPNAGIATETQRLNLDLLKKTATTPSAEQLGKATGAGTEPQPTVPRDWTTPSGPIGRIWGGGPPAMMREMVGKVQQYVNDLLQAPEPQRSQLAKAALGSPVVQEWATNARRNSQYAGFNAYYYGQSPEELTATAQQVFDEINKLRQAAGLSPEALGTTQEARWPWQSPQ